MSKVQKIQKHKESITIKEHKKIMAYINGNTSMRSGTKQNMTRLFTLLYFTGVRLNEVSSFRVHHIEELLNNGITKIITSKTQSERKIYISKDFKKELITYFNDIKNDDSDMLVIYNTRNKNKKSTYSVKSLIDIANDIIKSVLGDSYTSHCYRRGLLTEMAAKGTNIKIMAQFINHKNVQTTAGYINATDEQIMQNMAR